jgi:hypothetical protein
MSEEPMVHVRFDTRTQGFAAAAIVWDCLRRQQCFQDAQARILDGYLVLSLRSESWSLGDPSVVQAAVQAAGISEKYEEVDLVSGIAN